ncbi:hypothetical protein GIB67_032577 [Kingdonia uniflora]|uniref:No apical meristem-associated C-terminal domain-containing protein n=1 Tax=Kingdonia uniflora TaxID=39325 RepID=A0A7J7LSG7_9MAGN|nr:hypothetical protein GIB67_032577 [Kingdonia uniflora]
MILSQSGSRLSFRKKVHPNFLLHCSSQSNPLVVVVKEEDAEIVPNNIDEKKSIVPHKRQQFQDSPMVVVKEEDAEIVPNNIDEKKSIVPHKKQQFQHSQNDANASIPAEAAAPQKEKGKGKKKRPPVKQRPSVQVPEDSEFLDEMGDAEMHWTDGDFTCLARAWITTSVQTNGHTKGFTFYQKVSIAFNKDPEFPTRRSCGSTKSQWYALNTQCVAYKGIVAQERFRNNNRKIEEDQENDVPKIYKGLNGGNDFIHLEAYKYLAREPRWANLRDDGLNHAVNIPRNVARRTSDNSSPGNSVGSNNLSEDPDDPPIPQSAGPNSDLDGSPYEGGSRPVGQKLYQKNLASQKAMEGVTASGSDVQKMLDELQLEKIQMKEEEHKQCNTGWLKWIWSKQRKITKSWRKT